MGRQSLKKTKRGYCLAGAILPDQGKVPQLPYSCCASLPPVDELLKKFYSLGFKISEPFGTKASITGWL